MKRNIFGWDYPPGTEFHPDAPWNQKPQYCANCHQEHGDCTCEEFIPFDEAEAKEDYLCDKADAIRKYGKGA
jgi:hypothetical protein